MKLKANPPSTYQLPEPSVYFILNLIRKHKFKKDEIIGHQTMVQRPYDGKVEKAAILQSVSKREPRAGVLQGSSVVLPQLITIS